MGRNAKGKPKAPANLSGVWTVFLGAPFKMNLKGERGEKVSGENGMGCMI